MKKYLRKLKKISERRLLDSLAVLSKEGSFLLDYDSLTVSPEEAGDKSILLLHPDSYITLTKTYKVISKKELTKVIENEKYHISPFGNSYVLYRIKESDDGRWLVTYYFVDIQKLKQVEQAKLVFVWDDIVRHSTSEIEQSSLITSPFGTYILELVAGNRTLSCLGEEKNLRHKVISQHIDGSEASKDVPVSAVLAYSFSFDWLGLSGSINKSAFRRKSVLPQFTIRDGAYVTAFLITAALLESLYLYAVEVHITDLSQTTAEQRNTYAEEKARYLDALSQYENLLAVGDTYTDVSSLTRLLNALPDRETTEIKRLDFLQGEVRISGMSNDISALMGFLGQQDKVHNLDFFSPITPGDKGRDRFAIKFEYRDV